MSDTSETQPLLNRASTEQQEQQEQEQRGILLELWWVGTASVPLVGTYYLHYFFGFLNLISLGTWGGRALGSYALANLTCSILAFAPATGIASALDTLCSASFAHFGGGRQVGLHLQRGLAAITLWYLVVLVVMQLFTPSIYAFLGQSPELALPAASYLRILSLGLWPWMAFECLKRYVQANTQMKLPTIVLAGVVPLHLFNHWMFVWKQPEEVSFTAVAWITAVSYWAMFLGLALCTLYWDSLKPAWHIHEVKQLLSKDFYALSVPAIIEACGEYMAFEVMTLLATYLGPTSLAAQAIAFNTMSMIYQIPHGVGGAAAVRIGRFLGRGSSTGARFAASVLVVGGLVYSVFGSLFLAFYGDRWVSMYTKDQEVIAAARDLIRIAAVIEWTDTTRAIVPGILRGMGKQKKAAAINIGSYYLVVLPLAIVAIYGFGMGVTGLWAAFAVGMSVLSGSYILTVARTDWTAEVSMCKARIASQLEAV